jgi:regulator of sirC expression with transglutaminase-like and TPR domain
MDPTSRFAELAATPPDLLALDEAVLVVAAHDHPLDLAAELERLDALAARCDASIASIVEVLFGAEGFRGDDEDYHHPDNSFLDRVLERRRGLPILLSIVVAEVGARTGVCLAPVGMPGHFLLRDCADPDHFLDPFRGGRSLDRAGCAQIFGSLHPKQRFDDEFLAPIDNRAVLTRVVSNLVHTYSQRGPMTSLAWAAHLRALLIGGDAWRPVARLRERTGQWHHAATAWDHIAEQGGNQSDDASTRAAAARARSN